MMVLLLLRNCDVPTIDRIGATLSDWMASRKIAQSAKELNA